jgi:hypothetical protein
MSFKLGFEFKFKSLLFLLERELDRDIKVVASPSFCLAANFF